MDPNIDITVVRFKLETVEDGCSYQNHGFTVQLFEPK